MSDLTFASTSRTLSTPEGDLHYHEAGDGPPLLLLHGSGPGVSGWANFRGNLPVFSQHFRTLVLDLPGFGRSYSPRASPEDAAADAVVALLDGLGVDAVPIVGNSMGGGVAAEVAAGHRDRVTRLVTIGGVGVPIFSPTPPEGIKLLVEFVEDPTRERLHRWMESMVFDKGILTDEFVQTRWDQATDPVALAGIRRMYNAQVIEGPQESVPADGESPSGTDSGTEHGGWLSRHLSMLTSIAVPTLLTWGRDDRVTPLDGALIPLRFIPRCELHVFFDCGHWAMIERKEEFESTVISFLLRDHAKS